MGTSDARNTPDRVVPLNNESHVGQEGGAER